MNQFGSKVRQSRAATFGETSLLLFRRPLLAAVSVLLAAGGGEPLIAQARQSGSAFGNAASRKNNAISRMTVQEVGSATVIRLQGTREPMFSVFKLEKPPRLTVDLANCRLRSLARLTDVDTWAVSQIGTTEFRSGLRTTSRVVINFRRKAHYTVRTEGDQLVIRVVAHAKRPLDRQGEALNSARRDVAAATNALRAAEKEAVSAKSKAAKLVKVAEQERAEKERAERDAATARLEAQSAKKLIADLRVEARRAKQLAQQKGKEAKAQERQLRQQALKIKSYNAELVKGKRQLLRYRKALAAQEKRQQREKQVVERLRASVAKARAEAARRARHNKAQSLARQKLAKAERQLEIAERRARAADVARTKLAERVRVAESQKKQAELARAQAERSHRAAERQRQRALAARTAADRSRQQAELQSRKERKRRFAAEKAQAAANARARKLSAAIAEVRARQESVERKQEEVARLRRALAKSRNAEQERRSQLVAAQKLVAAHQAQASYAGRQRKQLNLRFGEAQRAQARLRKELARLRRELKRSKTDAADAQASVARLRRIAVAKKAQIAQGKTREQRSSAQKAWKRAAQRVKQAERDRSLAARARISAERQIADVVRRQKGAATTLANTKKRLAVINRRAADAERRVTTAQKQLRKENQQLAQLVDRRRAEQAARKQAQIARLAEEKRLESAKLSRRNAERARRAAQAKLSQLEGAVAALKSRGKTSKTVGSHPRIRNVQFLDRPHHSEVRISLEGKAAHRVARDGRALVMSLANAKLPASLERTLDTTAFGGPVKAVSSLNSLDGVQIRVDVAQVKGHSVRRAAGELVWRFEKPRAQWATVGNSATKGDRKSSPIKARTFEAPKVAASRSSRISLGATSRRRYTGRRIDLDFKDADIHNILRLLSEVGNVNIITSDAVSGSVTIRMKNVPWDQALDVILRAKKLGQAREGNLVRVALMADLEKEREAELARRKQQIQLQPLKTRLIPLSYAQASQVLTKLRYTVSPRGKVTFDDRTNMVIARDVEANLDLLEEMLRNLDTQTPQVMIEARIIEARTNFSRSMGIQWGTKFEASAQRGNATGLVFPYEFGVGGGSSGGGSPTDGILLGQAADPNFVVNLPVGGGGLGSGAALGFAFGSISQAFNLNLRLSAAESTGDIRIVSAPRVTTLDNQQAQISQGVTIPFAQVSAQGVNTVFREANLSLGVRPKVTADGAVQMAINVSKNEPDFANTGPRGDPTILTKTATTEMLVQDGDTAVIGGVYTTRDGTSWQKVPWFADIPILGWLFKNRSQTSDREEVLVFITPRIINRARSIGR